MSYPKMVYTDTPQRGDVSVRNNKHPGVFYRIVQNDGELDALKGYRTGLEAPLLDEKPVTEAKVAPAPKKAKKAAKKAAKKVV